MDPHPPVAVQLFYADVRSTVDWLCRAFGFAEAWTLAPQGELLMATLRTPGDGSVMISGGAPPSPRPNPFCAVTVLVPDVDAHAAQARAAGAVLQSEPSDQPWGYRDYEVLDLDGRQWNFSQVLHTAQPEDWGAESAQTSG